VNMTRFKRWIDQNLYPRYADNWDDEVFRQKILANLSPSMEILDLGAGAGIVEQMNFRGKVARVCGVDLDVRVVGNPYLDEGRVSDASEIPYPNESFDLVFCDNVFEHLESPLDVFNEVFRALKPGGGIYV
jgi:SAM-dependent methyltransferase